MTTSTRRRPVPLFEVLAVLVSTLALAGCFGGSSPPAATVATPSEAPPDRVAVDETIAFWGLRTEADPQDFSAHNKLADAYLRRARITSDASDYDRAERVLRASLEALPAGNGGALAQLAYARGAKHDFRDSLALAEQALEEMPGDAYVLGVLGDAQFNLGRYDDAESSYDEMARVAPGLGSFSRLAGLYELRGDLERARLNWRNAVAADGGSRPENSAWARTERGNFELLYGDAGAAELAYRAALEASPGYVHALAGLAAVEVARGRLEVAIEQLTGVTERYPLPAYVIALGDALTAAGRPEEARRQYALVDAVDQLQRASGVNTDLAMALFFADQGTSLDRALESARAATEERPGVASSDALAWVLYRRGEYEAARAHADAVVASGTRHPVYLFHHGMIALAQGDSESARGSLRAALEVNPQFHILYASEAARTLRSIGDSP